MIFSITSFFKRLNSAYYNYLLVFLALLFSFRPYHSGIVYIAIWKLFFTLVFFMAIFNIKHHRGVKKAAIILAIPTLLFSWLELFFLSKVFFIGNVLCTISFLGVCATSILFDVILRAKVTLETLRGVVCAYFMIAFVFGYIFYLTEYLVPGSFHLIDRDTSFITYSRDLSQMMYFSFVTLLTIGFGDITPLKNFSQTFVVIEGIIGQFYVAILVARIVAVYSFVADKRLVELVLESQEEKKKEQS